MIEKSDKGNSIAILKTEDCNNNITNFANERN
jgi:hypothetical protein